MFHSLKHPAPKNGGKGRRSGFLYWGPIVTFQPGELFKLREGSKVKECPVGGWTNPFEKYARQIGLFPQNRGENKKCIFETITKIFVSDNFIQFFQSSHWNLHHYPWLAYSVLESCHYVSLAFRAQDPNCMPSLTMQSWLPTQRSKTPCV